MLKRLTQYKKTQKYTVYKYAVYNKEGFMNFAMFSGLNASKFPKSEFIIESYPSKGIRRSLTWEQFDDQANKIANYLMNDCGVKKGDIVVHLMMNCMEWYASYIAVLKTGATVTPLNFRFASDDIKYAADVTKCKVFMFGEQFNARVEPIMKEMDYCKNFICLGKAPAGVKSYKEIIEKGDGPASALRQKMMIWQSSCLPPARPAHQSRFCIPTRPFSISVSVMPLPTTRDTTAYISRPTPFTTAVPSSFPFHATLRQVRYSCPWKSSRNTTSKTIADEKCTGGWNTVPTWSDVINAIKSGQVDVKNYDLSACDMLRLAPSRSPISCLRIQRRSSLISPSPIFTVLPKVAAAV